MIHITDIFTLNIMNGYLLMFSLYYNMYYILNMLYLFAYL